MNISEQQLREEAAFADSHYAQYANELAVNAAMFRKYTHPKDRWDWRQYGASLLGSVDGRRLLDLGCGMGEEAVYFALRGAHVTAIDISLVGVEIARKRAAYNGVEDRVRAEMMRADQTEFADESFDIVHGFGILHHIGLEAGLCEIRRVLKPGGRGLFFEHMGNSAFIESLRKKVDYTQYEKPLKWGEIVSCSGRFSKFILQPFHIVTRLRSFNRVFTKRVFKRFDYYALKVCPGLKHFASGVLIYLEK